MPMPLEIEGLGKAEVRFVWDEVGADGTDIADLWGARELRLRCTCAHCVSESTGMRTLDPASVPTDLTIRDMRIVGNYGVGITFSDGHGTGIFRFRELFSARREAEAQGHA